jgi:protein-tyrosine phosphatase
VDPRRIHADGESAIGSDPNKQGNQATIQNLMASNPTPEQLRTRMITTYGEFAFSSVNQYAAVFQQLKSDHLPLLYHCTAGKDRTGVFSALLLLTLGVPEKTVLEDYALTNRYMQEASQSGAMQKMMKASGNTMNGFSKEQLAVMMAADPAYLESTLRQIDAKYGSFDEYRRKELKVSDADVQTLRARLTLP